MVDQVVGSMGTGWEKFRETMQSERSRRHNQSVISTGSDHQTRANGFSYSADPGGLYCQRRIKKHRILQPNGRKTISREAGSAPLIYPPGSSFPIHASPAQGAKWNTPIPPSPLLENSTAWRCSSHENSDHPNHSRPFASIRVHSRFVCSKPPPQPNPSPIKKSRGVLTRIP